jgi:16S rRNA (uracil1498-N3)-methyltransferase
MGADGSPAAAAAPWRVATAQVLVADLDDPATDDATAHHLRGVLRLRAGEVVCATDGAGGWRLCRHDGRGGLEADGEVGRRPAATPALAVGFAPVKGDRPEWVVQKLTELGIDRIVVITTRRSVVRWSGERCERHLAKLDRVAREASQQCRRLWLPRVEAAEGALLPAGVLADAGGRAIGAEDRLVLVGPEGGWTDEERAGRDLVAVGDNILRAETAAVACGVVMTAIRAGRR